MQILKSVLLITTIFTLANTINLLIKIKSAKMAAANPLAAVAD
ncbi:hypothetical protein [Snodgrassella sp. B3088]|nr:hypothetical protein [Snodgrassella sp. B3088]